MEPSVNCQSNVAARGRQEWFAQLPRHLSGHRELAAAAATSRGGPIRDIVRTIGRQFEQGPNSVEVARPVAGRP